MIKISVNDKSQKVTFDKRRTKQKPDPHHYKNKKIKFGQPLHLLLDKVNNLGPCLHSAQHYRLHQQFKTKAIWRVGRNNEKKKKNTHTQQHPPAPATAQRYVKAQLKGLGSRVPGGCVCAGTFTHSPSCPPRTKCSLTQCPLLIKYANEAWDPDSVCHICIYPLSRALGERGGKQKNPSRPK